MKRTLLQFGKPLDAATKKDLELRRREIGEQPSQQWQRMKMAGHTSKTSKK